MATNPKYQFYPLGDEYEFEEFIKDLFNERYGTNTFQTYKAKGAKQYGIDVYSDKFKIYIQCKKKDIKRTDNTLKKELKEDFDKSIKDLNGHPIVGDSYTFYLASTAKRYDIQDHATKLFERTKQDDTLPNLASIMYLAWDEIEQWLQKHHQTQQKYYPIKLPPKPQLKEKELTEIPRVRKTDVIGRGDDLQRLKESLEQHEQLLLVNGLGGIGKTTLAKLYVEQEYDSYDHLAWVSVTDNFGSSLLSNQSLLEKLGLQDATNEQRHNIVQECLNRMKQFTGKNLLVIDNATHKIEQYKNDLWGLRSWKIILTSREELDELEVTKQRLDVLNEEDGLTLFRKYYEGKATDEEIKKVLTSIGWHTMTIQLLAKTFQQEQRPFSDMIAMLKEQGLDFFRIEVKAPQYNVKPTIWDSESQSFVTINQTHINHWVHTIFSWDEENFTNAEIKTLRYFSIMPCTYHNLETLEFLFQLKKLRDQFVNTLELLVTKGWIDRNTNEEGWHGYKCHQMVQHVVRQKTQPSWGNCNIYAHNINEILHIQEPVDNPLEKISFIPFGETLVKYLAGESTPKFNKPMFYINLGGAHRFIGDYCRALELMYDGIKIARKYDENNLSFFSIARNNIATVYEDIGQFQEARNLYKEVLEMELAYLDDGHPDLIISYNNLAQAENVLGNYEQSKELYEKSLNILNLHYGSNHNFFPFLQSNIANNYHRLGELQKALDLYTIALNAQINLIGENHPKVVETKTLLAELHLDLDNLDEAQKLAEQNLLWALESLGEDHPEIAIHQSTLGNVHLKKGNADLAEQLISISIKNESRHFGKNYVKLAIKLHALGWLYYFTNRKDSGIWCYEEAYRIAKLNLDMEHPLFEEIRKLYDALME